MPIVYAGADLTTDKRGGATHKDELNKDLLAFLNTYTAT